jgi:Leucine-rich repeat (LRR) protein
VIGKPSIFGTESKDLTDGTMVPHKNPAFALEQPTRQSTFLSSFHKLVLLDLDDNQFARTIPSELGSLDLLEFLLLNRNQLTGTVPQELSGLSSLRT